MAETNPMSAVNETAEKPWRPTRHGKQQGIERVDHVGPNDVACSQDATDNKREANKKYVQIVKDNFAEYVRIKATRGASNWNLVKGDLSDLIKEIVLKLKETYRFLKAVYGEPVQVDGEKKEKKKVIQYWLTHNDKETRDKVTRLLNHLWKNSHVSTATATIASNEQAASVPYHLAQQNNDSSAAATAQSLIIVPTVNFATGTGTTMNTQLHQQSPPVAAAASPPLEDNQTPYSHYIPNLSSQNQMGVNDSSRYSNNNEKNSFNGGADFFASSSQHLQYSNVNDREYFERIDPKNKGQLFGRDVSYDQFSSMYGPTVSVDDSGSMYDPFSNNYDPTATISCDALSIWEEMSSFSSSNKGI